MLVLDLRRMYGVPYLARDRADIIAALKMVKNNVCDIFNDLNGKYLDIFTYAISAITYVLEIVFAVEMVIYSESLSVSSSK